MKNLRAWLAQKLTSKEQKFITAVVAAMLIFATIGFADATHLSISHYTGTDLRCGPTGGCNTVTGSAYATVFGIPVALLGAIYYASMIILSIAFLDARSEKILNILKWIPILGLGASVWFVFLQLFVIHAICLYCMVSAGTSTMLFLLSLALRTVKTS